MKEVKCLRTIESSITDTLYLVKGNTYKVSTIGILKGYYDVYTLKGNPVGIWSSKNFQDIKLKNKGKYSII